MLRMLGGTTCLKKNGKNVERTKMKDGLEDFFPSTLSIEKMKEEGYELEFDEATNHYTNGTMGSSDQFGNIIEITQFFPNDEDVNRLKGEIESLNVGVTVNTELLTEVAKQFASYVEGEIFKTDGMKRYINQFGEDCGFDSADGMTQEYLYPYIKTKGYNALLFLLVHDESNREVEKILAWITHAKYWRNGKSFESIRENYYINQVSTMIGNRQNKVVWKTERDIISFLSNIKWM